MFNITVNGDKTYAADLKIKNTYFSGSFNGQTVEGDFLRINAQQFHFLIKNKSFRVDVLKVNHEEKSLVLKVNASKFTLHLKDKYDELLHSLGLDTLSNKKVNEIKAPMPGMVLKILVAEGDTVKKGDGLIVLEAMKMENILKSPADGTIKKIAAIKGNAVEKNQILIQF